MRVEADSAFSRAIAADPLLGLRHDRTSLQERYDELAERFHALMKPGPAASNLGNARYHKQRYLHVALRDWHGRVLDVGNDKPFFTWLFLQANPDVELETISLGSPPTMHPLHHCDIEFDPLPFADASFDGAILSEVIEHLWRDPATIIWQINRVLRPGGQLLLTTPNPCERHAIVCALWQSPPNGRGQIFKALENGHLHLWTGGQLRELVEVHGMKVDLLTTRDLWGYTAADPVIDQLVASVSPAPDMMGECIELVASKASHASGVTYPKAMFPEGGPVAFVGALAAFARRSLAGG
jgi:SAM-dependent methyltransferase